MSASLLVGHVSGTRRWIRAIQTALAVAPLVFVTSAGIPGSSGPPDNDNFANAQDLGYEPGGTILGTTLMATLEAGEPGGGTASAWYLWRPGAEASREVIFRSGTYGSPFDVQVYEGSNVWGLTPVPDWWAHPWVARFAAVATHTYYVRVSSGGSGGPFELEWSSHPLSSGIPAIASAGTSALVVYADGSDEANCVWASRAIPPWGTQDFITIDCVSSSDNYVERFSRPAVAWNQQRYLVVWESQTDEMYNPELPSWNDIVGRFVSSAGVPQGLPFTIARSYSSDDTPQIEGRPAVRAVGQNFLVAWVDSDGIAGTRVSGTGTRLDPAGIRISDAPGKQDRPSISVGNGNWLVTWDDGRSAATNGLDVYGTLVNGAGKVRYPAGKAISTAPRDQWGPASAWNGSKFFAAWSDARTFPTTGHDVYGARISRLGIPLDPGGLVISALIGNQNQPTLTRSGPRFVIAFGDNSAGNFDIRAARLDGTTGAVLATGVFPVNTATGDQWAPVADSISNGTVLIAWEDWRNLDTHWADIYAARIKSDGTVLDPSGVPIAD